LGEDDGDDVVEADAGVAVVGWERFRGDASSTGGVGLGRDAHDER
jgi:hypothetical protein